MGGNTQINFKSIVSRAIPASRSNKLAQQAYAKNMQLLNPYSSEKAAGSPPGLGEYIRLWFLREITFTMNRVTLATIIFGLMGLGILFFVIGFLVAVATIDRKPPLQPQHKFSWAGAANVENAEPRDGFLDRELKSARNYTAGALARITRQKATHVQGQILGNTVATLNSYVPEALQPFAMHAEQEVSQVGYEAQQQLGQQVGQTLSSTRINMPDGNNNAASEAPVAAVPPMGVPPMGAAVSDGASVGPPVKVVAPSVTMPSPSPFQQALQQRNDSAPAYQNYNDSSSALPAAAPAPESAAPLASYGGTANARARPERYILQVAIYPSKRAAINLNKQLQKLGLKSYLAQGTQGSNRVYVVRIGHYEDRKAANQAAQSFQQWFHHRPSVVAVAP